MTFSPPKWKWPEMTMTENDRNIILLVKGNNELLDALKCWLLVLYMIVCVVLL